MPIHLPHNDKQATADMVAALILVAWAEMRQYRNVDYKVLAAEWQKIKDELSNP